MSKLALLGGKKTIVKNTDQPRRGYVHDDEVDGLWKLMDIVPTISHIMEFSPPGSSKGAVMSDIFD